VERAERTLTTRDTVLLITRAAGKRIAGRTVMQKLAYFAGLALNTDLGHRPHFYGPYSSAVEDAVSNAVIAGELHETLERMPHWRGGPDLLKYTYDLTEAGDARVERLIAQHQEAWALIRDQVAAIKDVLPALDQKTLSSAAKTYLIITESDRPVVESDIPSLARSLGWDLGPDEVCDTTDLLEQLELIEPASDEGKA